MCVCCGAWSAPGAAECVCFVVLGAHMENVCTVVLGAHLVMLNVCA